MLCGDPAPHNITNCMMKKPIKYNPRLSISENARFNGCSESNIRYYIKKNGIDRASDKMISLVELLRDAYTEGITPYALAQQTKKSINTIKKYWNFINGEDDVSKLNSQKRQKLTLRQKHDYYATSPEATEKLLELEEFGKDILEPCCGGGFMAEVIKKAGYSVTASDIMYRGYGEGGIDFLSANYETGVYDVITNPPYQNVIDFIKESIRVAKNKVAILMPLRYLSSQERYALYQEFPPSKVYVFVNRIAIAKNGEFERYDKGANTTIYAWYIWEKDKKSRDTLLRWIK